MKDLVETASGKRKKAVDLDDDMEGSTGVRKRLKKKSDFSKKKFHKKNNKL